MRSLIPVSYDEDGTYRVPEGAVVIGRRSQLDESGKYRIFLEIEQPDPAPETPAA